ncbi:MAG: hypothetical protein NZ108_05420, partial [Bacteroidia bacterium]|nr:hypothetical protein [Bacteroidia bacterium]
MQQLNYWVLRALAKELEELSVGMLWYEAFSQQKDELVIGLADANQQLFLRVGCMPEMQYIVPVKEFRRAKTNRVALFDMLVGKQLCSLKVPDGERMILLELSDGFTVVLKMHGTHANVIVYEQGEWISQFRSRLSENQSLGQFSCNETITLTGNPDSPSFKKQNPWWDKIFQRYWIQQINQGSKPHELLEYLSFSLAQPKFYVGGTEPGLYLVPLESI